MLYRRGRPTSVVLLLLMVVPKLSLPLSGHSPLGLHHLFRLVRAARGLVALGGVEVLQIRRGVRAAGIIEVGHGVGARTGTGGRASVWRRGSEGQWAGRVGVGPTSPRRTHRKPVGFWRGREWVGTHDGPQHLLRTSCRS